MFGLCNMAATMHCLAIDQLPTISLTWLWDGYFTFWWRVEETAPKVWSQGLATIAVQGEQESITIKSTSTISKSVYIGNLIWLLGMTIFLSKLTKEESQAVRFSDFKFSPLYRLGYIISIALPWSTSTFFTLYLPILRVTIKELSWGWMVQSYSRSRIPRSAGYPSWPFSAPNQSPQQAAKPHTLLWTERIQSFLEQQR